MIQARYGLGKHFLTIDKKYDYVVFNHVAFWQAIISAAGALMFLKVSIALSLLRLSKTGWYKWALWSTIGKSATVIGPFYQILTVQLSSCLLLLDWWHVPIFPSLQAHVRILGQEHDTTSKM